MSRNDEEAQTVDIMGRPFPCPVCGHDRFYRGKAQLNTRLATFFNVDWANRYATYIACERCGHMSWFRQ